MGFFSRNSSNDKPLPLFGRRDPGTRTNYLLRWGCERDQPCTGLFRTHAKAQGHDKGHGKK